jgi:small-conductance mechanosensitive channel
MNYITQELGALSLTTKVLCAVFGVVLIRTSFGLLERILPSRFGYVDARYRARKLVVLAGYIVGFAFIGMLFKDRLSQLGFTLSILGAGIAVALQDVVASIAGSVVVGFATLYRVGDRIQIGETKGDVIDISLLRTTLMETGNWVSGDLYNGRVVRVPNNVVLRGLVFNYSQGFRYVWDEVKVRLTYESDHVHAREMLQRVVKETVTDYLPHAHDSLKRIAENYRIEKPLITPSVTLVVTGGSLEFSVSYLVDYTRRTALKDQLFTKIVDQVANSKGRLQWASASTTVVLQRPNSHFQPSSHRSVPVSH